MDRFDDDCMTDTFEACLPVEMNGLAARTELALANAFDAGFAELEEGVARHVRACEVAMAGLFEVA